MITVRPACEADLDRLVEIHAVAFPDPRGVPERFRNFRNNPHGGLGDLRVAELEGVVVGHAFLFPLRIYFGGRPVSVGGLASLGVAPEARGQGVARQLLADCHQDAFRAGHAITLLYAFRQAFYADLGYAPVSSTRRLLFSPSAVPRAWAAEPELVVRAPRGTDRASMENTYASVAPHASGLLERTRIAWDGAFADERRFWLVAVRGATVTGYVAFHLVQAEAHAKTLLRVRELVAHDAASRRRLVGALGAMRDQVAEIELEVDATDPLERALVDADRARYGTAVVEHELGKIVGGPMVRLADVTQGLLARGYGSDGELDLVVKGEPFPLRLRVQGGTPIVRPAPDPPRASLRVDRSTLAAIAYGALRPSEAHALGLLATDGDPDALSDADRLFDLRPFLSFDPF